MLVLLFVCHKHETNASIQKSRHVLSLKKVAEYRACRAELQLEYGSIVDFYFVCGRSRQAEVRDLLGKEITRLLRTARLPSSRRGLPGRFIDLTGTPCDACSLCTVLDGELQTNPDRAPKLSAKPGPRATANSCLYLEAYCLYFERAPCASQTCASSTPMATRWAQTS